ncbi:MAG: hypothetical protein E7675_01895 [Ruminococcaceae bacterium]|nr:hypothetical protein [Oscillospiraceae bacterium]
MFNIGDTVMYRNEGVCKLAEITEKNFSGKAAKYYVLRPIYKETARVYVPVDNELLVSKMKKILSSEEIEAVLIKLSKTDSVWIADADERKQYYSDIKSSSDRAKILGAVIEIKKRQIPADKNAKKPHIFDLSFMRENEKIICEEFALALGIKPSEVWDYIEKRLGK